MQVKARIQEMRDKLLGWLERKVPEQVTVTILAVITGIIAGCLASLLKHILNFLSRLVFSDVPIGDGDWRLLVFPMVGVFLAMIYQRYIIHQDVSHGTAKIRDVVSSGGKKKIQPWVAFNSLFGCGLTVGLGGSAGSEGPLAYSGAAVGSSLGQVFRLSDSWMRVMIGVGAGAGIAGIFKAPIGGTLYTLEVLQMEMNVIPIMALMIACVMASVTCLMLSGYAFDWAFVMKAQFDPASLGWMFLLGVFCGLYSIWYLYSKSKTDMMLGKVSNRWIKALIAGVMTAVVVFCLPLMFGEGCSIIETIINGGRLSVFGLGPFQHWNDDYSLFIILICAVLLVKGPLVAAANSGGGVAGDFVPALYIGGVAGYMFGIILNDLFGVIIPVWYCSLAGMGAVLACSTHAPLMALFLMCETTNSFQYMPAYLVSITTAYCVVKILRPRSKAYNSDYDVANALWSGGNFILPSTKKSNKTNTDSKS